MKRAAQITLQCVSICSSRSGQGKFGCVFGKSAFARHPSVHGELGGLMPVGYGLSETCAFVFTRRSDATRQATRRSRGRLLPGNQLRVIDPDTGRALGVDEEGELAVKAPTLMLRHLGKEPADCFDEDGFFHTGDAGHLDEHGEVHVGGRRTEMVNTGGANVSRPSSRSPGGPVPP